MDLNSAKKRFCRKFKSLSLYCRKGSRNLHNPFCNLPLELVELVASSLQSADLGALRRTCKVVCVKVTSVFWEASLQSIKTDLSCANLGELETLSRDAQFRHHVKHMVFKGFDECLEDLGEGYHWSSHRHPSGHLVNLGDHPAIQHLSGILCQLANCRSFEIYAILTHIGDQSDNDNFRPTDAMTVLMDIVARDHIPVSALIINFMHQGNNAPDPRRLQVSDKEKFITIGRHLKELELVYELDNDIVRDWTFNVLIHAPHLRILHLQGLGLSGGTELLHRLVLGFSAEPLSPCPSPWSQLEDLHLKSIPAIINDLVPILQRCRYSLRVLKIDMMRIDGTLNDVKYMLRTLSTEFPALASVSFTGFKLGVFWREFFINFPAVVENPLVDGSQGAKFEFAVNNAREWPRVASVAYSGPNMDVALDILARTVDATPVRA